MRAHGTEALARDGEMLGGIIDQAHVTSPDGLMAMFAEHAGAAGLADLTVYLQDYDQLALLPLPHGSKEPDPEPVEGTLPGHAFSSNSPVETPVETGTRLWLPMLNGTDRVGGSA